MNINRNNYEEYFLLYADKELPAHEKNMVEMFVRQNPDLEEEFIMLQQSVIKADNTITLEDKGSLFRQEFISLDNYEEKFLLYADNELSLSETEETEKFVLANPSLQAEFSLLQQVTFKPDTSIVFPGKQLLYKKEENAKVIPFRWKSLAAAVIVGIGLWTGISYLQNEKTEPVIVNTPNKESKNDIAVKPVREPTEKDPVKRTDKDQPTETGEQKIRDNNVTRQDNVAVKEDNRVIKQPGENKLPEPKQNEGTIQDAVVTTEIVKPSNELPQAQNNRAEPNDNNVTRPSVKETTNYAMPASYINDEEVKSDNYVFFHITAEEFKKSKVGNFLKKVKRSVERRIPFRGNGLKIGSVEISKDGQN